LYRFFGGKTVFSGVLHANALIRPVCRSRRVVRNGQTWRIFKTLQVGQRKVALAVLIPRLLCKDCGAIRQAALDFADPEPYQMSAVYNLRASNALLKP